jgi:signal transduction histidine kinase
MAELTAQILRLAPQAANELARAVGTLTGGNPFDTVEMINALRDEGVLTLEEHGWRWDELAIRRFVGRSTVADLLATRIASLAAPSRELLEFTGCIGNTVDFKLLCAATGLGEEELQERLGEPLTDGLLVADSSGDQIMVRFRHDRVQQAVMLAMDDAKRAHRALAMARRLIDKPEFESEAAQQYIACIGSLDQPDEQRRAVLVFQAVAQRLASAGVYVLAERYLAAASTLLANRNDPADGGLRSAIDMSRHAALYSLGRLQESDDVFADVRARVSASLELVAPTCHQMRSLIMRLRTTEAMQLGLSLLAELGLQVPQDFAGADTQKRLDALKDWVARDSQLDHSNDVQCRDPRVLAVMRLLAQTARAASIIRVDPKAAWVLLECQRLWASHGPTPALVGCLGMLGPVLISLRQDYRTAFEVCRHACAVGKARGHGPQTLEALHVFYAYTSHWFDPVEDLVKHFARPYDGLEPALGVSYSMGYAHWLLCIALLESAHHIDIVSAEIEVGITLCQRTGNLHAEVMHKSAQHLVNRLRGQVDSTKDARFRQEVGPREVQLPVVQAGFALEAILFNNVGALCRHVPPGNPGLYLNVYGHLCTGIATAWQMQREAEHADKPALASELDACVRWMEARSSDQPHNFLHLLRLLEAERAWALGDAWRAALAFDLAMKESETRQRPWHRAFITERAGLFQLSHGLEHTGRVLLAAALDHYAAWGAHAKVEQMRRDHPFLHVRTSRASVAESSGELRSNPESTNTLTSDGLDLMGVLSASQALSSETSVGRLAERLTDVLATLAGATKVLLLLRDGDQWWLQAPDGSPVPVKDAADSGLMPISSFDYAQRTREPLLVDDATHDDRFAADPYFADQASCSLLMLPVASQGVVRAMLYLENNLGAAAFNGRRLDAVMLIAGQLAVSLANAQLYDSLEQRVQARTRELQQAQSELMNAARRAGKAEIANNVLHNVGNILNSVNVSAQMVRSTIAKSKFHKLERAVALMEEHANDLSGFIESDRGKNLLPYLHSIIAAIREEQRDELSDLERLTGSVDHINNVVAAQQSYAGHSSVLEMVRPQDVLEEALRLSGGSIERHGITLRRDYDEVPAMALDKQRLLQIFVNLINNAMQAMEGVSGRARVLTLGTCIASKDGMDGADGQVHLRFFVQDEGEGIPCENLKRVFGHGFTTRAHGHGFGLHSSALAAIELGGRLTAHSDGPGLGARFVVELPVAQSAPQAGVATQPGVDRISANGSTPT